MATISTIYLNKWLENEQLNFHLPLLKHLSTGLSHVTEMGTRDVTSTWALLAAKPDKVVSIDWNRPPICVPAEALEQARQFAEEAGIGFDFIEGDTTDLQIEITDLLFIDTWHTYEQILLELLLHSDQVRRYIVAHDTNERYFPGMSCGIEDFLNLNPQWVLKEYQDQFPGITVLERVADDPVSWGDFDGDQLRAEIEHQHELYFKKFSVEEGPTGIEWLHYKQLMVIRFSDAQQWPKSHNTQEVLVINWGNSLTGMVAQGNLL